MPLPLVIAHRGDSSHALENSLEAVRLALSLGVDMIEVDVRKSRDNRLYLMHDRETGRTAEGNIDIEQAESGVIAELRLKNGEPVPLLSDVLTLVAGGASLNLEIKSDGAGALCAAHLAGSGYRGPLLCSSFQEREVIDARRVLPNLATAGIFDSFSVREVKSYRAKGYGIISLKRKTVSEALVTACHEQKIKVYVWTLDDEAEMKKFISWGVDGIYTNKPAVLKAVIMEMKR
ncbi:MAG: hypothetical protein A2X56_13070 [Nitrospirae bacterium GWC2_57_13]|jgi:glycerophosphoryl diester phosphodiesterase|nr:MAG: hypothetical protein A2X56_13070 [Nitrospirae bacterium GWC2_57_13]OGW41887.1 MAG: hypothetical protein A2X57_12985 [Nitrospirae bacterium GWD2_57_8]HAS55431.1 hypothetical protein [Nitrospiraceae bacterium]